MQPVWRSLGTLSFLASRQTSSLNLNMQARASWRTATPSSLRVKLRITMLGGCVSEYPVGRGKPEACTGRTLPHCVVAPKEKQKNSGLAQGKRRGSVPGLRSNVRSSQRDEERATARRLPSREDMWHLWNNLEVCGSLRWKVSGSR